MQPRTASTLKLKVRMLVLYVSSPVEGCLRCARGANQNEELGECGKWAKLKVGFKVGFGIGQHSRPNGAYVDFWMCGHSKPQRHPSRPHMIDRPNLTNSGGSNDEKFYKDEEFFPRSLPTRS
jgi:hypothetical protein